ncbi:hypothetical protein MTR67_026861 [Solanum verrucosum]|uniref:Gag-pol polyprotein n=1 Tax=Solanum verrucosum TaxID=315347 RepID=A0AAF0R836_SOLVR|nr:hypothetical protein MTR67_026861 [Solanum verrucosum]
MGNDNVEPEDVQLPVDPLDKFQTTFQVLGQVMTAQANRETNALVNPKVGMTTTRLRDFTRMNPLEFHGSKVDDHPQEFIDEFYEIVGIMGFSTVEKVELATDNLKGTTQLWFEQWKSERAIDAGPFD